MYTKDNVAAVTPTRLPRIVRENPRDTIMKRNLSKRSIINQSRDDSLEKRPFGKNESNDSLSPARYRSVKLPQISSQMNMQHRSSKANMEHINLMSNKKRSVNQTYDSRSIVNASDAISRRGDQSRKSTRLHDIDETFTGISDTVRLNRVNLSVLNPDEGGIIHHLNNANTLRPYGIENPTKLIPRFVKKEVFKT